MQFNLNKIKLIIGLGNIGKEFIGTRHNVGFDFLDYLCKAEFSNDQKLFAFIAKDTLLNNQLIFAKPTTLMNLSGNAASSIIKYYRIEPEEIVVAYDDLDLRVGDFKIQFSKHPHDHNGVNSIIKSLKSEDFWNIRIGVDGRDEIERKFLKGRAYVLNKFHEQERLVISETFINIKSKF